MCRSTINRTVFPTVFNIIIHRDSAIQKIPQTRIQQIPPPTFPKGSRLLPRSVSPCALFRHRLPRVRLSQNWSNSARTHRIETTFSEAQRTSVRWSRCVQLPGALHRVHTRGIKGRERKARSLHRAAATKNERQEQRDCRISRTKEYKEWGREERKGGEHNALHRINGPRCRGKRACDHRRKEDPSKPQMEDKLEWERAGVGIENRLEFGIGRGPTGLLGPKAHTPL